MIQELMVPEALCCTQRDVRQVSSRIVREMFRSGSANSIGGLVDVRTRPEPLALSYSLINPLEACLNLPEKQFYFCLIFRNMQESSLDTRAGPFGPAWDDWYIRVRDLILASLDHFWFCVALLSHANLNLPNSPLCHQESRRVYFQMVKKILVWVPSIIELQ